MRAYWDVLSHICVLLFYSWSDQLQQISKSLPVILVKFLKAVQLSIMTSPNMFNFLFHLCRTLAVQRFRLRFLLRPIVIMAAAIVAHCSAIADVFPHTNECAPQ